MPRLQHFVILVQNPVLHQNWWIESYLGEKPREGKAAHYRPLAEASPCYRCRKAPRRVR
jgi:hypothetical protein